MLRPTRTVERSGCVVGVKEAAHRLSMRAIRRGELPPLKPTSTVERRQVVVGVKEAAHRLCLRAIRRGEVPLLKPVTPKVVHSVVVTHGSKPSTRLSDAPRANENKSETTASTMRANAHVFAALNNNEQLSRFVQHFLSIDNAETRQMIVDLL